VRVAVGGVVYEVPQEESSSDAIEYAPDTGSTKSYSTPQQVAPATQESVYSSPKKIGRGDPQSSSSTPTTLIAPSTQLEEQYSSPNQIPKAVVGPAEARREAEYSSPQKIYVVGDEYAGFGAGMALFCASVSRMRSRSWFRYTLDSEPSRLHRSATGAEFGMSVRCAKRLPANPTDSLLFSSARYAL
jgi:hypothetical protein